MGGIPEYPEQGKREDKEIYRYTTLTDDLKKSDHGRFHRTYFTLEQAKSAALIRIGVCCLQKQISIFRVEQGKKIAESAERTSPNGNSSAKRIRKMGSADI